MEFLMIFFTHDLSTEHTLDLRMYLNETDKGKLSHILYVPKDPEVNNILHLQFLPT